MHPLSESGRSRTNSDLGDGQDIPPISPGINGHVRTQTWETARISLQQVGGLINGHARARTWETGGLQVRGLYGRYRGQKAMHGSSSGGKEALKDTQEKQQKLSVNEWLIQGTIWYREWMNEAGDHMNKENGGMMQRTIWTQGMDEWCRGPHVKGNGKMMQGTTWIKGMEEWCKDQMN